MKKVLLAVFLIIGFVGLAIFFYPKPSSSYPTEFSIQLDIRQGMREENARTNARWNTTICNCLGIERTTRELDFYVHNVCHGIVLGCMKTK